MLNYFYPNKKAKFLVVKKNKYDSDSNEYYNSISCKYDDILNSNPLNIKIRNEVKQYFLKNVSGKYILDFGGGTGKDLEWLTDAGYNVFFCEPSDGMRNIAVQNNKDLESSGRITFLDSETANYVNWSNDEPPFNKKVDAILSNFAVLNSINELAILSEKLALVTQTGSHFIFTVLNLNLKKFSYRNILGMIQSVLKDNCPSINIKNEGKSLKTYLHTKRKLISSMKKHFSYVNNFPLSGRIFNIYHFVRNEQAVE